MAFYSWITSITNSYDDLAEIEHWVVLLCLTASPVPGHKALPTARAWLHTLSWREFRERQAFICEANRESCMFISAVPVRAKQSQKIEEESEEASYCSPTSCLSVGLCEERNNGWRVSPLKNIYDMLIPACFLALFHFVVERKGWHTPLWLMSLGIVRVVPLIKIFVLIPEVISMKLQKETHPFCFGNKNAE